MGDVTEINRYATVTIDFAEVVKQRDEYIEILERHNKETDDSIKERDALIEKLLNDNDKLIAQLKDLDKVLLEEREKAWAAIDKFHEDIVDNKNKLDDLHAIQASRRLRVPKHIVLQKRENANIEKVCPIDGVTLLFDENGDLKAELDHINGNPSDNSPDNLWFVSIENHRKKTTGKISRADIYTHAAAYLLRERSRERAKQRELPLDIAS